MMSDSLADAVRKTIGVSRDGDGNFVIQMDLDLATITADPTKGF